MTVFSLDLALRQRGSFTPRKLFAGGTAGVWYDPSDIGSMFQDSAGTIAAAINQPVGKLLDKSGRGNHAIQATSTHRPVLRQDSGGFYYLEFDGVDDRMSVVFSINQTIDRISAIQNISWTTNDRPFGGGNAFFCVLTQSATPGLLSINSGVSLGSANLATGVTGVVTERHAGMSSRLAINNGAYVVGNAGTTLPEGITLADGSNFSASRANVRIYGVVMIGRALADSEIGKVRRFMAAKSGVSL